MARPEYPRNRILYLAGRAEVLVRQRSIDEAVATAVQVVEGRIARTRAELARYSANLRVAEFLDWSAEVLAATTHGRRPRLERVGRSLPRPADRRLMLVTVRS
ncbi:MAG: hypothetical protein ACRDTF_07360 [Pseudonocardiaceae bacterium]